MTERGLAVPIVGMVIAALLIMAVISLFTPTPGYYPNLSISMMHWYSHWEIDGNGNVSFKIPGPGGWPQTGSARLTPQQVGELVAAIQKANVWAMRDSYGTGGFFCGGGDCHKVDLSITLNGWSKHILYFEAFCQSQFWGAPPQALCNLPYEIEAIGWSAIPTAMPIPTVTPAPPTSTPPAIMRAGDFGILSREPCGPPCFLGIRPGVTTFDEAVLILKNAGVPCKVDNATKFLICASGNTQITVRASNFCPVGDSGLMVEAIGLAPPAKITLGEFIAQYGAPDSLLMNPTGAQATYDSLQTLVFLHIQPAPSYTVMADTTINDVGYLTVADYPKCLHNPVNIQQPWKGYGIYTTNARP